MTVDIKDDVKKKKSFFGLDVVIKKITEGKLSRVYMAANCPKKEQLTNVAQLHSVELILLTENNKDLGTLCKKPFSISVVGFE